MIRSFPICIALFAWFGCAKAQQVNSATYDFMLRRLLSFSVPSISVVELVQLQKHEQPVLLDTREPAEYQVSHIANARNVGYTHFAAANLADIPKNTPIIVYCSVGYRSEKVGEQLQKAGFTQVRNLYGSIFEWVNQGQPVVDSQNKPTQRVHAFDKKWGIWLRKGQKVY